VGRGELPLHPTSSGATGPLGTRPHQLPLQPASAVSSAQAFTPAQQVLRRGSQRPSAGSDPTSTQVEGCGIPPSRSLFYPYMPLPSAVALRRAHRMFPLLDRVNARAQDVDKAEKTSALKDGAAENLYYEKDHPLARLFVDHLGALHGSGQQDGGTVPISSDGGASGREEHVLKGLEVARNLLQDEDEISRSDLRQELKTVLELVHRQSEFLGINLDNMEKWCKDNFVEEDYAHVYSSFVGDDDRKKKGRRGLAGELTMASGVKAKLPTAPIATKIKVRIRCQGFREPTMASPAPGQAKGDKGSLKKQRVQLMAQFDVRPEAVERAAATARTVALREVLLSSAARQVRAHAAAVTAAQQRAAAAHARAKAVADGTHPTDSSSKPVSKPRKRKASADKISSALPPDINTAPAVSAMPLTAALLLKPKVPYAEMSPPERLRWVAAAIALRAHTLRSGLDARARERAGAARARDEELARIAGLDEETMLLAEERAKIEQASGTTAAGLPSLKPGDAAEGIRQTQKQQPIAPQPQHILNTVSLWETMERSPFMADFSEEDAREVLREAWQPEASRRAVHWYGEAPTPKVVVKGNRKSIAKEGSYQSNERRQQDAGLRARNTKDHSDKIPACPSTGEELPSLLSKASSPTSLFDRLQSLLVDEDTENESDLNEDEEECIAGYRKKQNGHISLSPPPFTRNYSSTKTDFKIGKDDPDSGAYTDVSGLSVNQRAYLHLRAAGLIDNPILPSEEPAVIEEHDDDDNKCESTGNSSTNIFAKDGDEDEGNDIDFILRRMANDLSDLHRRTNVYAATLQSSAGIYLSDKEKRKEEEEKNAQLIAKHTELIRKQGERKREEAKAAAAVNRKEGQGKDDEGWIPW